MKEIFTMKTAFTLIEILIVVILLGVLAAIVVPQFMNSIDDGKDATCVTNLNSLITATALYRLKEGKDPASMDNLTTPSDNNGGFRYMPEAPVCGLDGTYQTMQGVWNCTHDD
jgi:general secretion pathway protein G